MAKSRFTHTKLILARNVQIENITVLHGLNLLNLLLLPLPSRLLRPQLLRLPPQAVSLSLPFSNQFLFDLAEGVDVLGHLILKASALLHDLAVFQFEGVFVLRNYIDHF